MWFVKSKKVKKTSTSTSTLNAIHSIEKKKICQSDIQIFVFFFRFKLSAFSFIQFFIFFLCFSSFYTIVKCLLLLLYVSIVSLYMGFGSVLNVKRENRKTTKNNNNSLRNRKYEKKKKKKKRFPKSQYTELNSKYRVFVLFHIMFFVANVVIYTHILSLSRSFSLSLSHALFLLSDFVVIFFFFFLYWVSLRLAEQQCKSK